MKRGLVLVALVVVGALLAAVGAAQQTPTAASIQVDKIRDNLYVFRGGGGSTGRLKQDKGVTWVNRNRPGGEKRSMKKLKEITDNRVTTIINPHALFDHVSGNSGSRGGVDVVPQKNPAKLRGERRPPPG